VSDSDAADAAIPEPAEDQNEIAESPAQAQADTHTGAGPESSTRSTERTDMFAKWTVSARQALHASEEEAVQLGDHFISDEHIFLGLVRTRESKAGSMLAEVGITVEGTRAIIAAMSERGHGIERRDVRYVSPKGKQAIMQAVNEARQRRHRHVTAEHLLLALTQPRLGFVTCDVLRRLGISPRDIHQRTSSTIADVAPSASPHASSGMVSRLLAALRKSFRQRT